MFEQGTPGPSANSNMIERLTNLSSKGAEPQRPIEGLRRHLRIDPKRSDLVLHAACATSGLGRGCVKTLTFEFRVEFLSEFLRCESQFCWQPLSRQRN